MTGGPLQSILSGDNEIALCGEAGAADTYSFGIIVENTSDETFVISGATFESIEGLTVLDYAVIPAVMNGDNVGVLRGFPPKLQSRQWKKVSRRLVEGAVIEPDDVVNLVIGLRLENAATGKADGMVITYESHGEQYAARNNDRFAIRASCR